MHAVGAGGPRERQGGGVGEPATARPLPQRASFLCAAACGSPRCPRQVVAVTTPARKQPRRRQQLLPAGHAAGLRWTQRPGERSPEEGGTRAAAHARGSARHGQPAVSPHSEVADCEAQARDACAPQRREHPGAQSDTNSKIVSRTSDSLKKLVGQKNCTYKFSGPPAWPSLYLTLAHPIRVCIVCTC